MIKNKAIKNNEKQQRFKNARRARVGPREGHNVQYSQFSTTQLQISRRLQARLFGDSKRNGRQRRAGQVLRPLRIQTRKPAQNPRLRNSKRENAVHFAQGRLAVFQQVVSLPAAFQQELQEWQDVLGTRLFLHRFRRPRTPVRPR